jgi:hypothetical protein
VQPVDAPKQQLAVPAAQTQAAAVGAEAAAVGAEAAPNGAAAPAENGGGAGGSASTAAHHSNSLPVENNSNSKKHHLLRHEITAEAQAAAIAHFGAETAEEAAHTIWRLRQKELQAAFARVYGVPTNSCNNGAAPPSHAAAPPLWRLVVHSQASAQRPTLGHAVVCLALLAAALGFWPC